MRKWQARLGGVDAFICAEKLHQVGDYVTLYANSQIVGLIRLGAGDFIFEVTAQP